MKSAGLHTAKLPLFYRDMLKLWSESGNTVPVDKENMLWYNRGICVNNRSLFYSDLFTAGAWYIKDLYESDGKVIAFETWVCRGVSRHSSMKWIGLVHLTKKMLVKCDHPSDEVVMLSVGSKRPTLQVNDIILYNELLLQKTGQSVHVPRIAKHCGDTDDINWKEVYLRANRFPMDTKTKEFQYKFLHELLSNKYWLNKWGFEDTADCTYCDNDKEDIVHMFWECTVTKRFWRDFSSFCCNARLHNEEVTKEDVFLGTKENPLCTLIFTAKRYIYNKRVHVELFTFSLFKMVMRQYKNKEFSIAKNNNMVDDWFEKWSFLE